jgi:hypothetical protein
VGLFSNEPTIAANPFNANNVVIANYNQGAQTLKISNDGGATFPITTNAAPGFHDGDDSLAFDSAGRLFWSYLAGPGVSVVVQQVNPTTGALIGNSVDAAGGTTNNDKAWLAADSNPASPFKDNLYIVWNDFNLTGAAIRFARSTNHGASWTVMSGTMSGSGEGFTWPAEVDVGPNGDVWVAWHVNTIGDGTNGQVRMRRSTDGGVTFGPEITPFPAGTADAQLNSGSAEYGPPVPPRIYKFKGWLQGSLQPRILPDPARPGNIYVISVTDPDQSYADDGSANGDASDIVIARSTDNGATWTRSTIGTPNDGKLQIMPAASIDQNGNIAVTWYQDLRPVTNPQGDWMLGLFATTSTNGGVTFTPAFQVTDANNAFDPDLNAPDRFGNQTLRIGEYNGVSVVNGTAYAVWTGNEPTGQRRQETYFDKFTVLPPAGPSVTFQTPAADVFGHFSSLRVGFDESIDIATFTPDKVFSFTGPGGPIAVTDVTVVAGTNNTQFDLTFADQAALGAYTIVLGPDIRDTFGHQMDQNHNGIPGEIPGDRYTGHFNIQGPKIIASSLTPGSAFYPGGLSTVTVTFNEAMDPATFTVGQVNLTGPAGQIPVTGVSPADDTNTRFTITFSVTATGHYTLVIGPNILDAFGNAMDQDGNFIPGEIPGDQFTTTFNIRGPRVISSQTLGDFTNGIITTVRVSFDEAMDPTSFTPDQVKFTGPGNVTIAVASITATNSSNTQFDIAFAPQGKLGNYSMVIGPNVLDAFGNAMDQNGNFIPGEVPGDQYTHTFTVNGPKATGAVPLPGGGEPVNTLRVTFSKPIDVTTFTPAKIASFQGPGGPIGIDGIFPVPGSNFTQFDIDFKPQTAPGAFFTQSLDDGSGEVRFNNSESTDTEDNWVANSFQVTPGGETLTSVSFFLGENYSNRPVTVLIYTGSSLTNPHAGSGLTRVSTTDTTVSGTAGSLVTIPLSSALTLPLGQVYWAAILMRGVPSNQFPFYDDTDAPKGRSWFDVGPTKGGAYNVDDTTRATVFGGTHPVVGSNVQNAGNLLLRVNSTGTAYKMVLGSDIRDLFGNKLDQNGNLIDGEIPADQFTATFTLQGLSITTPGNGGSFLPGALDHVRLTFSAPVNALTFTPSIVSLTGPGGPVTVKAVTAVPFTDYTQFDVSFDPPGTTGAYSLVVAPTVQDLYGNKLDQNGNGVPGEDPGDRYTLTFSVLGPRVTSAVRGLDGSGAVAAVRVSFSEAMNGNTFTADQAVLKGPTGAVIPLTGITPVDGSGATQFDLAFAPQSANGTYTLTIGPGVLDLFGNALDQDGNLIPGETPGDQFVFKFNPAAGIFLNHSGGFATHNDLTANGGATFPGTVLQLTSGGFNQARSVFSNNRVDITSFSTTFIFQIRDGTTPPADGLAFVIQGNSPTALGALGGGLGYQGIPNSVAVKFDIFNNQGEGTNSTGLFSDGRAPSVPAPGSGDVLVNLDGSGIDLKSTHPFRVDMNYDGTTLNVTITDTVTLASASQTYTVNISAHVHSNTAYVGFTGGTGSLSAIEEIQSWAFPPFFLIYSPPGGGAAPSQPGGGERGVPAAFRGGAVVVGLPSRMGGPAPSPGGAAPSGGGSSTGGGSTAPAGAPSVSRGGQAGVGSTAAAGALSGGQGGRARAAFLLTATPPPLGGSSPTGLIESAPPASQVRGIDAYFALNPTESLPSTLPGGGTTGIDGTGSGWSDADSLFPDPFLTPGSADARA